MTPALALLVAPAVAADYAASTHLSTEPAWSLVGAASTDGIGHALAAGDFDGDGTLDLVAGNDDAGDAGSAWLYLQAGGVFDDSPALALHGEDDGDGFGDALATLGDVDGDGIDDVAVTARGHGDDGRIYVYAGGPDGLGATAETTLNPAFYLRAFDGAGDVNGDGYADLLVSGELTTSGAELFLGSATGIDPVAAQTIDGTGFFGQVAAGGGDLDGDGYADAAVSAYEPDDGYVDVYAGSPDGLTAVATLTWPDASPGFGESITLRADTDGDGYADLVVGGAHVVCEFAGSSVGVATTPGWCLSGPDSTPIGADLLAMGDSDGDGRDEVLAYDSGHNSILVIQGAAAGTTPSVYVLDIPFDGALAPGDFDGDGYADFVAGTNSDTDSAGEVELYVGSAAGLTTGATPVVRGDLGDAMGTTVASGDLDGDGIEDLVVAEPGVEHGDGRVALWYGAVGGPAVDPSATLDSPCSGTEARFGATVAVPGDLDGDGFDDLVVAAGYACGNAVRIYRGGAVGIDTSSWSELEPAAVDDAFGYALVGAGDLNGDGFADLAVGTDDTALLRVYLGDAGGLRTTPQVEVVGAFYADEPNHGLAGVGDVDADGYDDLVAANSKTATATTVTIYPGGTDGLDALGGIELEGPLDIEDFGHDAAAAGDVDGDGYADVVVGAPGVGAYEAGQVRVFHGSATGPRLVETLTGTGNADKFGDTVAGIGDPDGDGFDDLAVTADGTDIVYVYAGSAAGVGMAPVRTWSDVDAGDTLGWIGDVNGDAAVDLLVASPAQGDDGGRVDLWLTAWDADGDGYVGGIDCDDGNPAVHPGGTEVCDDANTDEDCDGVADGADAVGASSWYADADGDGYGDPTVTRLACDSAPGWVTDDTDCDDTDATIHPGGVELVDDGVDEDCHGGELCPVDADGDGAVGVEFATSTDLTCGGLGATSDCDDADASVHPGATDVPGDGIDQDCDGFDAEATVKASASTAEAPCGCTTAPGSSWLAVLLGALAWRRTRR